MLRHVPRVATVGVDKGAVVRALESEGLTVTEWVDDANATYAPHRHPHREVRVVLEGAMTISCGGEDFELRAGDRLDLEGDEEHSARVHDSGVRYLAGSAT